MMINKIGVCEWALPVEGPAACRLAAEVGFEGMQLDIGPWERGFPKSRKFVRDLYLEYAQKYGLEYPSMAVRAGDYYSLVDEPGTTEHEIVRAGILAAVEAAEYMDIPLVMIPTFEKSRIRTERHFQIVIDMLREACRAAADSGITIAAENTLSVEQSIAMVREVNAVNFALYFDFQNYYLANDDSSPRVLEQLYPHVVEVHVKDGKNKDLSGALLGTGDADFFASMEVLRKNGYEGWLISENYYDMPPLCIRGDDPMELMRKDVSTLRKVLSV
jgi:2-epi-5-epi-valiolone 7-phosphate 2-epimerase